VTPLFENAIFEIYIIESVRRAQKYRRPLPSVILRQRISSSYLPRLCVCAFSAIIVSGFFSNMNGKMSQ